MRADHGTLAALNAGLGIPDRNFERQVPLLPPCRGSRERSIHPKGTDRKVIAPTGIDWAEHFGFKMRGVRRKWRRHLDHARHLVRYLHLEQVCECFIYCFHIPRDNFFAFAAIGLADRLANRFDGFIPWEYLGYREEADLQDGVHAAAHARIARYAIGVDNMKL